MAEHWISLGVFAEAHGLKGEVWFKPFTAEPGAIATYSGLRCGKDGPEISLSLSRTVKGRAVVRVAGVTDRDAAEQLKGQEVFLPRDDLPKVDKDEFYFVDLIGLKAVSSEGKRLGEVCGVEDFGAGNLLDLHLDEPVKGFGRSVLIPFAETLVPEVDIDSGRIIVDLAAWLAEQDAGNEKE